MWLPGLDFQAGGGQAAVDQVGPVLERLGMTVIASDGIGDRGIRPARRRSARARMLTPEHGYQSDDPIGETVAFWGSGSSLISGTGLPTAQNTHQVAQGITPDARIVYIGNDPMVLAYAQALLTSIPEMTRGTSSGACSGRFRRAATSPCPIRFATSTPPG